MSKKLTINVELSNGEALALAQFFKRVCLSNYEELAANQDEAYKMQEAGIKLQQALAEKGVSPR
jgi:hypothetical protein